MNTPLFFFSFYDYTSNNNVALKKIINVHIKKEGNGDVWLFSRFEAEAPACSPDGGTNETRQLN